MAQAQVRKEEVQVQPTGFLPGAEARGFAIAQSLAAYVRSHASELRRIIEDCFNASVEERAAAAKYMRQFIQACVKNSQANQQVEGMSAKDWSRLARSATVRVSQMTRIIRAMNAGFDRDTLAKACGVADPENVAYDVVLKVASNYLESQGAGARTGRKPDTFAIKLAKWLKKNEGDVKAKADKAFVHELHKRIDDILPSEEEQAKVEPKAAKQTGRKPNKPAAPKAYTGDERRVEEKAVKVDQRSTEHNYH